MRYTRFPGEPRLLYPPTKMGDKIFNIFLVAENRAFKEINNTKSTLRWTAAGSIHGRKDMGTTRHRQRKDRVENETKGEGNKRVRGRIQDKGRGDRRGKVMKERERW
jgi:hypothetical protein